jgi:metallo-beta-lactamase family protein
MKVKFIGATKGVSGSCSLLKHTKSNTNFLVDCGVYIGGSNADWLNKQSFPFNPTEIQFVLLTHAHLDHCGLIPKLYKDGFVGKVFCTKATAELAKIVMLDCAKNSRVYSESDVYNVDFVHIDVRPNSGWGRLFPLAPDLRASFLRGSHILGSSSVCINWEFDDDPSSEGKTILFTGDIGCNFEDDSYLPLLKDNHLPFPDTDYIVIESTYGGRNREALYKSDENRLNALKDVIIENVFNNNGKLFIPTFSIHRTQEILFDIHRVFSSYIDEATLKKHLSERIGYDKSRFAVYCDSPMGQKTNQVFAEELLRKNSKGKYIYKSDRVDSSIVEDLYQEGHVPIHGDLGYINVINRGNNKNRNKAQKKKQSHEGIGQIGSIIIASAGMCDAGPIVSYLEKYGTDENNTIAITGFQASGSKGRAILDGSIPEITAKVVDFSGYYSAHADESGLLKFLFDIGGQTQKRATSVFINHGMSEAKDALENAILSRTELRDANEREITSVIKLKGEQDWFDLNTGQEFSIKEFKLDNIEEEFLALHNKIDKLTELVELLTGSSKTL